MASDGIILNKTKVSKAVAAVLAMDENVKKKDFLADHVEDVHIQICVKKIPYTKKVTKLDLPRSILKPEMEVCLFVKDLDRKDRDYEPTVRHFQELLEKKGVTSITEIIPLKSLKLEYQPFEAKRNLSNAYDLFLADERIMAHLPRLLGKHFLDRKKVPVQINVQASDLMKEIKRAMNICKCTIANKGSSSVVTVGHIQMTHSDLVENIAAVGEQISKCVPGGANNVKQLLVKAKSSTSVPIYIGAGGPQGVYIEPEAAPLEPIEAEEVTTVIGAKVQVHPDGRVLVIRDGESVAATMARNFPPRRSNRKRGHEKMSKNKQKKRKTVK